MPEIHVHEIHHETPARQLQPPPLRDILECLPIPIAVGLLVVAWPLVFGVPTPPVVIFGALLWGGKGAWAVARSWRAAKPRRN